MPQTWSTADLAVGVAIDLAEPEQRCIHGIWRYFRCQFADINDIARFNAVAASGRRREGPASRAIAS